MRIAVGQLSQESNTFNPLPTARADYEAFGIARGTEVLTRFGDINELGGFVQALRTWPERPEIVGLVRLQAWPSGAAAAETFGWLRDEVIGALRAALPVDGVLLSLHGALVADGTLDVEGAILRECRALLGPDIPLVATLDLHANVTDVMVRSADALYSTTPPHTSTSPKLARAARPSCGGFCRGRSRSRRSRKSRSSSPRSAPTRRTRPASATPFANSCKNGSATRAC
jgi:microcystin degradation protein MlrC